MSSINDKINTVGNFTRLNMGTAKMANYNIKTISTASLFVFA